MSNSIVSQELTRGVPTKYLTPKLLAAFEAYSSKLMELNTTAGFTSLTDRNVIVQRHFVEPVGLLHLLLEREHITADSLCDVADIGTGGGFPSVPMALVHGGMKLSLIESNKRKADSLRQILEMLEQFGLLSEPSVFSDRVETIGRFPECRGMHDVVVSRAVARVNVMIEYALPLLKLDGILALVKGSRSDQEIQDAQNALQVVGGELVEKIELPFTDSVESQYVILIQKRRDTDDRYPRRPGIPIKRPL